MYKSLSSIDYKKHFSLPIDYEVEGCLSYGGWMEDRQRNEIEQILKDNKILYTYKILEGFLSHVLEIRINNKNYWFIVMYGGTMLSEYIHLACLFGSKKNIHVGSCGGLSCNIDSLDILIPLWVYGNESITRIYDKGSKDFKHFPDKNLSSLIEQNINKDFNVKKGPIITNQAMMGETLEDIKLWSEQGYYGVEMEVSTVFSVSNNFNVPSAAVLYVSDNLIKGQIVGDESHLKQKNNRDMIRFYLLKIGLLTLIN